jgi:hypothetical protein
MLRAWCKQRTTAASVARTSIVRAASVAAVAAARSFDWLPELRAGKEH